jgi:imidazole glycerol-phosphate synthase subunit HisH
VIGIIDYGIGNRRSVEKAFAAAGADAVLTDDAGRLREAEGLVLLGVGAFRAAMEALGARGFDDLVRERAAAGVPVLGLCLGMQLLFDRSEELGGADGLGLLRGEVRMLEPEGLKVPHIGWNVVRFTRASPLVAGLGRSAAFYHVHSLVPHPADDAVVLGRGEYGGPFVSIVEEGHVMGCQFHPEKSSRAGLALLGNFARLCTGVPA